MFDWAISRIPRRCCHCGKRIKRNTLYVAKYYAEGGIEERYCDALCAKQEREVKQRISDERDKLNRIIYGGEE